MASAPCSDISALYSGDCTMRLISVLSLSRTSFGVPAGAHTAFHWLMSNPGSVSASAGTSGNNSARWGVVTARARNLPAFICCSAGSNVTNPLAICPPSKSMIAGAMPLYGTCTMSIWVSNFSHSPAKCWGLAAPAEPNVSDPGFAFAYAIYSFTDLTGTDGCTTSASGLTVASVIGAKSLTGSYGIFGKSATLSATSDEALTMMV